ncbi:phenylalanine ammonia-lyase [Trifolium repens]|nr:phenylalanine ammonia-lyase [Trifolium repens]
MTSVKTADRTTDNKANMFASKSTVEATPDPTAVPLTRARPSFGFNSKNPEFRPAKWKASLALRDSFKGPTALEFRLPVSNAAM